MHCYDCGGDCEPVWRSCQDCGVEPLCAICLAKHQVADGQRMPTDGYHRPDWPR